MRQITPFSKAVSDGPSVLLTQSSNGLPSFPSQSCLANLKAKPCLWEISEIVTQEIISQMRLIFHPYTHQVAQGLIQSGLEHCHNLP